MGNKLFYKKCVTMVTRKKRWKKGSRGSGKKKRGGMERLMNTLREFLPAEL